MISVILPCFNEMRHGYLPQILANLRQQQGDREIIAAVSPSQDDTAAAIAAYPEIKLIQTDATNRAQRLNAGVAASSGEVLLLHHPATLLPEHTALSQIEIVLSDPTVQWGGFRHQFDLDHWLLRFTSWYSTTQRGQRGGILYLDHCPFLRRSQWDQVGGMPDLDIFEDTVFCEKLRELGLPGLTTGHITTSARRFRDRGIYRHAALNQALKVCYYLGIDPRQLNWLYEHKSAINVKY